MSVGPPALVILRNTSDAARRTALQDTLTSGIEARG